MSVQNSSNLITEFIITGLDTTKGPLVVGVIILIVYVVALLANLVNILLILSDTKLHKPMYLLICNLAAVDILYSSSTSPTMIGVLLVGVKTISNVPCLMQMFVFNLAAMMEMFALSLMAFDRLIAISCPFKYHIYLTNTHIVVLTFILWVVGCGTVSVLLAIVIPLPHCYSVLRYAFCDYAGIIRTTCIDPNYYFSLVAIVIFVVLFFSFGFICLSYIGIMFVVKLSSSNDKMKMGSTCVNHLIVVTCFYLPLFIIAILTRIGVLLTIEARNGLVIGSILGPALINPFVYCFRTTEIKSKIIKIFNKVVNYNITSL